MPRKHLQGDPEIRPDEQLISGATLYHKFLVPLVYLTIGFLFVAMVLASLLGAAQTSMTGPESCVFIGFLMLATVSVTFEIRKFLLPLKEVWMGDDGLLVSNFEFSVRIPFEAVEEVTQRTSQQFARYVVVTLDRDTPFGRRFTFNPVAVRRRYWSSPTPEDDIVAELRWRVESARRRHPARKAGGPIVRPGRSIMADDELDGPI